MPSLPTGPWEVVGVAATHSQLNLTIGANGSLSGSLGLSPVTGFWDERTQKITFIRRVTGADGMETPQIFTGYHFIDGFDDPFIPLTAGFLGPYEHRLAGFFESFSGSATRIMRGWYAQITVNVGGISIDAGGLRPGG